MNEGAKPPRRAGDGGGAPRASLGGGQFRGAVSTYDKRAVLDKRRELKARKLAKYRRVLKRLEAAGKLAAPPAALGGGGPGDEAAELGGAAVGHRAGADTGSGASSSGASSDSHGDAPLKGGGSRRGVRGAAGAQEHAPPNRGKGERGALLPPPPPQRGALPGPPGAARSALQADTAAGEPAAGGDARRSRPLPKAPSQLERLAAKRRAQLDAERAQREQVCTASAQVLRRPAAHARFLGTHAYLWVWHGRRWSHAHRHSPPPLLAPPFPAPQRAAEAERRKQEAARREVRRRGPACRFAPGPAWHPARAPRPCCALAPPGCPQPSPRSLSHPMPTWRAPQPGREQKARRDTKSKFFAKTRRGQPVMRHRLDKILGELQGGG